VTVGPGATWRAAVEAAEPFGLAPLAGSGPSVGVIGSTLGGGIGWLGRRHGLASESLQTADVVLPDGRLITVDGRREHELLWALRGGRSALGVVVRATLRLHPVAGLAAGALLWPIGRARTVLGAWARWTATAPEATTSMGRILRMPPTPDVPAPLRGRGLVAVELAHAGPDRELAELLAPLRALAPEIDTVGPARPTDLLELARDPETPTPAVADHLLLRELPDLAVESLVDAAGADGHAAPAFAAIRHLGGALARPGAGALGSIPAPYVLVALAVPAGPVTREAAARDVAGVIDAMSPWAHHRTYLNFAERPTSAAAAFGHAAGALAELKRRLDPERLLLGDLAGEPRPH
jgi:FAD/FMN-containing dehydrogenase